MTKPAYYNEFDKNAAAWLRELIKAGHIADGDVDERNILDVLPSELRGYTQCHFFAGIGVWSYALRRAGWSDDRPVWTGSCPCQPFSQAGDGLAFADERHLWPAFHHLIKECRPECVTGEQVASKDADAWIDLVQDDMEGLDYAFGAVAFPSASVGAPHIRDRTYWVANGYNSGLEGRKAMRQRAVECFARTGGVDGGLADMHGSGCVSRREGFAAMGYGTAIESDRGVIGVDNSVCIGRGARRDDDTEHDGEQLDAARHIDGTGPTNGHWRDADWLYCRDGKWRPVEPGTFPLAHGAPARVVRLRGYGNAINAIEAKTFIESFMEIAA
ncbi:MAG: DNA cytosine methyltransferase [Azonexus sp.]